MSDFIASTQTLMLYVVWIKLSLNESYGNRFSESLLFISKFKNLVFTICSILGVRADAGGFGGERSIPTDAFRISNPGSVTENDRFFMLTMAI
jgi:hypothetical protein